MKNRVNSVFAVLLLAMVGLIQGCASQKIVTSDTETLDSNEGYLLVRADIDWDGIDREDKPILELSYRTSPNSIALKKAFFVNGNHFLLLKEKVGSYYLTHAYYGFDLLSFPEPIPFTIKRGGITYLGDFKGLVEWPKVGLLSKRNLKIEDNYDDAMVELSKKLSAISKRNIATNQSKVLIIANQF